MVNNLCSSVQPKGQPMSTAALPDFFWSDIPKRRKIYQMTRKYYKWPQIIPNGRIKDQHLLLQDRPKFTQIGIFGFKIYKPPGNPGLHFLSLLFICAFSQ
jgi:hypothetical protein